MKVALATAAVLIAATLTSAANADNYGTSKSQAAQMTALVYKTFGNGWQGRCMVRIMWRESGGNPRAANYRDSNGGSYGLIQANAIHKYRNETVRQFAQRMFDPVENLALAKRLYNGAGFSPWNGCPS